MIAAPWQTRKQFEFSSLNGAWGESLDATPSKSEFCFHERVARFSEDCPYRLAIALAIRHPDRLPAFH